MNILDIDFSSYPTFYTYIQKMIQHESGSAWLKMPAHARISWVIAMWSVCVCICMYS